MNTLQRIVNYFSGTNKNTEKRSAYYQSLLEQIGGVSDSGFVVNSENALTHATVFACIKVLSESFASLPGKLHRHTPTGGTEVAYRRPENRLISISPSERYTSYIFRQTGMVHLCLRGNFYARIYRDGRGGARELVILHPDCVRPFYYNDKLYYEVSPHSEAGYGYSQNKEVLMPSDILHVSGLGTNGIVGKSTIQVLKENIGIGLTARKFAGKALKDGTLRGIIKSVGKQNADQISSIRTNFSQAMNEGRFPLLENGLDFQTISLTPADAEFLSVAKLNRQDIAGAFRVPLHMVADLERATFSNIEHQSLEFVKYTLLPWITNWEGELNRKLLPYDLQGEYYFKFNVDGLLRGDFQTRMNGYTKAIQWGIYNRDEVRALEDMNPIPDGKGQVFITPLNMIPIDQQDDQVEEGEGQSDNTQKQKQNGTGTN
jgi:HK97 family phage portal protein